MPEREKLESFAATGATLAIHLAVHALGRIVAELTPFYGPQCPVAIVARASWPDQIVLHGTLESIEKELEQNPIERTALVLVGPALAGIAGRESALYDPDYRRRFRS
jgi:precorrin-4/cobalt-precorrin-4 C11-methyltransferase